MKILILNQAEVKDLLPMPACIAVMRNVLAVLAKGQAHQPLRMVIRPPDAVGLMGLMPAYIDDKSDESDKGGLKAAYGLKAVCVFPGNPAQGKDAHQGSVMLFSAETGELLALMNASAITAIRTAAVSGVATQLLAREEAGDLALIGAGAQAHAHLAAMAHVRPLKRVRVASERPENAAKFATSVSADYDFPIEAIASVEAAVRGADLVVTVTTATDPILQREWLSPGAHLNVVGSSVPTAREVDTATMAAANLFVDRRVSTLNEAGDYLFAMRDGAIGPEHIQAELGELLLGVHPGRTEADQITLFKSLGLAVEDVAAAMYIYEQAQEKQVGTWVSF